MQWWYYVENDKEIGPVPKEEFLTLVDGGRIRPETMVWSDGMEAWQPYALLGKQSLFVGEGMPCIECQKRFPADELISYKDHWVCANCKPVFFQRIREGVGLVGAMEFAGFWIRFGAKVIDGLLLWVVYMTISVALSVAIAYAGNQNPVMSAVLAISIFLIEIGISMAYSVYFVGKHGATPGKMALGLKIVMSDGTNLNYGMATKRFFAEMLSAFTMYIGYLLAAFDEEKRSLHDRICDTRVIRK